MDLNSESQSGGTTIATAEQQTTPQIAENNGLLPPEQPAARQATMETIPPAGTETPPPTGMETATLTVAPEPVNPMNPIGSPDMHQLDATYQKRQDQKNETAIEKPNQPFHKKIFGVLGFGGNKSETSSLIPPVPDSHLITNPDGTKTTPPVPLVTPEAQAAAEGTSSTPITEAAPVSTETPSADTSTIASPATGTPESGGSQAKDSITVSPSEGGSAVAGEEPSITPETQSASSSEMPEGLPSSDTSAPEASADASVTAEITDATPTDTLAETTTVISPVDAQAPASEPAIQPTPPEAALAGGNGMITETAEPAPTDAPALAPSESSVGNESPTIAETQAPTDTNEATAPAETVPSAPIAETSINTTSNGVTAGTEGSSSELGTGTSPDPMGGIPFETIKHDQEQPQNAVTPTPDTTTTTEQQVPIETTDPTQTAPVTPATHEDPLAVPSHISDTSLPITNEVTNGSAIPGVPTMEGSNSSTFEPDPGPTQADLNTAVREVDISSVATSTEGPGGVTDQTASIAPSIGGGDKSEPSLNSTTTVDVNDALTAGGVDNLPQSPADGASIESPKMEEEPDDELEDAPSTPIPTPEAVPPSPVSTPAEPSVEPPTSPEATPTTSDVISQAVDVATQAEETGGALPTPETPAPQPSETGTNNTGEPPSTDQDSNSGTDIPTGAPPTPAAA